MAERQQIDERTDEQDETRRRLKRRGMLAATGAVVAGMIARQTAHPVAANDGLWTFPYSGGADVTGDAFNVSNVRGGAITASSGRTHGISGSTGGTGPVAGVYGTSSTAYGVIGSTTAAGYSGLTGVTSTPGVAALAASSAVPDAFAAYFTGATVVQGDFTVFGGAKSAAVPHADGSHRIVYCVESPEAWFEDFGKGQLVAGKADVKLDTDFAAIVRTDDYFVFLTPMGECKGLAVMSQNAGGFAVHELQAGTSGTPFAWRIVARRKDNPGKRLATFALPKINHPDSEKLPKL